MYRYAVRYAVREYPVIVILSYYLYRSRYDNTAPVATTLVSSYLVATWLVDSWFVGTTLVSRWLVGLVANMRHPCCYPGERSSALETIPIRRQQIRSPSPPRKCAILVAKLLSMQPPLHAGMPDTISALSASLASAPNPSD